MSFLRHIGLLDGIQITNNSDITETILEKGIEIIPNLLTIKKSTMEDQVQITNPFNLYPLYNFQRGLLVEIIDQNINESEGNRILDSALFSFRLHQKGNIFFSGKMRYYSTSGMHSLIPRAYGATVVNRGHYIFEISDINQISDLCKKLVSNSLIKANMKIAFDRFNKSYFALDEKDCLLDICISYEALFSQLSDIWSKKGEAIGGACSMLIGENRKHRDEIFNDIVKAFVFRNKIVHGSDMKESNLGVIREKIEDYLRKSIKKLIVTQ